MSLIDITSPIPSKELHSNTTRFRQRYQILANRISMKVTKRAYVAKALWALNLAPFQFYIPLLAPSVHALPLQEEHVLVAAPASAAAP